MLKIILSALLFSLLPLQPGAASEPLKPAEEVDLEGQRRIFLQAEQALKRPDQADFQRLRGSLDQRYPLYPYLEYAALRSRLSQLTERDINEFVTRYPDLPAVARLRNTWAQELFRRGNWQALVHWQEPGSNGKRHCQYATALFNIEQTDAAFARAEKLWLVGHSQPRDCDDIFQHWRDAGNLSDQLSRQRFQQAMNQGNARLGRYLTRFLSADDQFMAEWWLRVHHSPSRLTQLDPSTSADHPLLPEVLVHGYLRWARRDARAAADAWQELHQQYPLDAARIHEVRRAIGLRLSRHYPGSGIAWLSTLPAEARDETVLSAILFEALVSGRNQDAWEAIEELTRGDPQAERWRYWRARLLQQRGAEEEAGKLLESLAGERSYYGFLAADRILADYRMNHNAIQPDAAAIQDFKQRPGARRARELRILGRFLDARREWRELTRDLPTQDLITAAYVAQSWDWQDRAILTIAKARLFDDLELRFPLDHLPIVNRNSLRHKLDPTWVLAVVRQESAFARDAHSPAGAIGLMQLMPGTARDVARTHGIPYRQRRELKDPDTNIRLGSSYLRTLLDRFSGHEVLATAAYNAGPGRVNKWLANSAGLAADLWIERIPFSETRNYVKRVLTYTAIYQHRMGREFVRLSQRMHSIHDSLAEAPKEKPDASG